VLAGEPVLWC